MHFMAEKRMKIIRIFHKTRFQSCELQVIIKLKIKIKADDSRNIAKFVF